MKIFGWHVCQSRVSVAMFVAIFVGLSALTLALTIFTKLYSLHTGTHRSGEELVRFREYERSVSGKKAAPRSNLFL